MMGNSSIEQHTVDGEASGIGVLKRSGRWDDWAVDLAPAEATRQVCLLQRCCESPPILAIGFLTA